MTAKTLSVRDRLKQVVDKVPRSVMTGGHQATVIYKQWVVTARAKANNARTTDSELQSFLNHWESLNKEVLL